MNNYNILYRSIVILLFTTLLSSCLKETAVPIESAFTIESSEDKTSPVMLQLKNDGDGTMFSFQSRALRGNDTDYAEFYELVVLKDISVGQGPIMPWFNQPGQGIQIMFYEEIE